MTYKKHVLSNGVRLIVVPMPSLASATLTVWVRAGSRLEEEKIAGISHFLEHMVFKGSKKRPTARDIAVSVDAIGGEFNAGTSKEWTNFYIKSQAEKIDIAFDVLSDMVLNPIIDPKEIEKEKGVIIEEMAMYEDNPMMNIGEVYEELIFDGNTLARDTIGTTKAVKAVTQEDFLNYRLRHYHPQNMVLTVSGGVKESEVIKLAEKYFASFKNKAGQIKPDKFKSAQKEPKVKLKIKKNEQAHFIVGFLGNPMGHPDRFKDSVLAAILGQGMSSRLFTEVREKRGLAYSVRTSVDRYTDTGYLATYAGVDPKKAEEAIKIILNEHAAFAEASANITKDELKKAKEYIKGHMALYLEDTRNVNYYFGDLELMENRIETPEAVFRAIDEVTVDDIYSVAKKLFVSERLNLAIIGPYSNDEKFKKLLK